MSLLLVRGTLVEHARLDSMAMVKSVTTSGTASTIRVGRMVAAPTPALMLISARVIPAGETSGVKRQVQVPCARKCFRATWTKTTAMQMQSATIRVQDSTAAAARQDTLVMGTCVLTRTAVLRIHVLRALIAPMWLRQAKVSRVTSARKAWSTWLIPLIFKV